MAETRRRRGWRLSFVFVFIFAFYTTTCQVDSLRSAGVCAKRSNWHRKCRSAVCVCEGVCWEGRCAQYLFPLSRSFCGKGEERWSSWREAAGSFVLKFSKGWSSPRKVEIVVVAFSTWRRWGEWECRRTWCTEFFQAKVATLSNWPREGEFKIGSCSAEDGGGGRVPRTCTLDRWANLSNWPKTIAATYVTKNLSIWPRRNS
jgi:hypothetical protein